MADRLKWQAPRVGYATVFDGGVKQLGSHDLVAAVPSLVTQELGKLIAGAQERNGSWADGRFEDHRKDEGDWGLDIMLVDAEGRLQAGPWSSFDMFNNHGGFVAVNDEHASDLKIEAVANLSAATERFLIPLAPKKDTTLIWHISHAHAVLPAIREILGTGEIPIETYPFQVDLTTFDPSKVNDSMRRFGTAHSVQMTRLPYEKAQQGGKFAEKGVWTGQVGFWESERFGGYAPRVRFNGNRRRKTTFVSGMSRAQVLNSGGRPMEENHDDVTVLRTADSRLAGLVKPDQAKGMFIPFALDTIMSNQPDVPVVLKYRTYTPWTGNFPKHG